MARFGENFRSGRGSVICPVCRSHNDSQDNSFTCKVITNKITIKGNYKDIFLSTGQELPELVETLTQIEQLRKCYIEQ